MDNLDFVKYPVIIIVVVCFVALVILFFSGITMWLWNYVMPAFNLPKLNIWQATALFLLCKVLFYNK